LKKEDTKKIIDDLKKENKELKRKLAVAKLWMEKEVKSQVTKISKKKVSKMTGDTKKAFLKENIEDIITKQISNFFGELMLLNTPNSVVENIISAEVTFFNLKENPNVDWVWLVSSYHKWLDTLIEAFITKGYRKFAKKQKNLWLRSNDPLEKQLNLVVQKWYILSVWRLFHIIKIIKKWEKLEDFAKCFEDYFEKYYYLKDILFEKEFYNTFKKLIDTELLWKKRHAWKTSFEETKEARELFIGKFKDKNSLIYKFIELWKVDY